MLSSFFFFKQKTAYELRISDWSSDVCSSDLVITSLLSEWLANSRSRDSEALSVAIAFNLGFAERRFGRWRSVEGIGKQGTNSIAFDRHRVGIGRNAIRADRKSTRLNSSH